MFGCSQVFLTLLKKAENQKKYLQNSLGDTAKTTFTIRDAMEQKREWLTWRRKNNRWDNQEGWRRRTCKCRRSDPDDGRSRSDSRMRGKCFRNMGCTCLERKCSEDQWMLFLPYLKLTPSCDYNKELSQFTMHHIWSRTARFPILIFIQVLSHELGSEWAKEWALEHSNAE